MNGPLLDWDRGDSIARQIATFAMAASKLSPRFKSLILRPRWADLDEAQLNGRLELLPIQPVQTDRASTWIVPVAAADELLLKQFSGRLRRSLKRSRPADFRWSALAHDSLDERIPVLRGFARSKNFYVPDVTWFKALTTSGKTLRFFEVRGEVNGAQTWLLIAIKGRRAHFLFGMGPAVGAHVLVLQKLRELGIAEYDMNGFAENLRPEDPYYGVCEFKRQLGGKIERYTQPVFRIE